jgi:hypothetical protein
MRLFLVRQTRYKTDSAKWTALIGFEHYFTFVLWHTAPSGLLTKLRATGEDRTCRLGIMNVKDGRRSGQICQINLSAA